MGCERARPWNVAADFTNVKSTALIASPPYRTRPSNVFPDLTMHTTARNQLTQLIIQVTLLLRDSSARVVSIVSLLKFFGRIRQSHFV